MKSHFSFKIDKEFSIIFNVPPYSDSKENILVDKKWLQKFLHDLTNEVISNFFIVSRIHNVKQIIKFFKFIILRQFVEIFILPSFVQKAGFDRRNSLGGPHCIAVESKKSFSRDGL